MRYGVQVAAFKTRQRAEVVKHDVEARSAYKAELVLSSSGRLVKVVVGSYADRPSVDKVRDDLKFNFGFADCFVTTLQ
jgi:cell division protein FtsN